MAKPTSEKTTPKAPKRKRSVKASFKTFFGKFRRSDPQQIKLHKSFRRSYREDYQRDLETPGILAHIAQTFKIINKNWKLFLPLWILLVVLGIAFVGVMTESAYQDFQATIDEANASGEDLGSFVKAGLVLISTITTGGFSSEMSEVSIIFLVLAFLILWLTTIYILRQRLAEHKLKLRDALYNSMTPLISTFFVFLVILIQCIPIFLFIIFYSAAVQTDFLATPFYAFLFFVFSFLMFLLSGYLLSSSLIALVVVSAPGVYPVKALNIASDLMAGRRIRFIIRLIALLFALAILWVIVMMPLIMLDMWLKSIADWLAEFPFIPICLLAMSCFTMIYATAYIYLYYRWMLDYNDDFLERHSREFSQSPKAVAKPKTRKKYGKK